MKETRRLPSGGRIDRARPLTFVFDGKTYHGCAGDTLSSALLANGVFLQARSFKYHRPRGPIAAGSEEPNALVTLNPGAARQTPNVRATTVELHDGLIAQSQNRFPALAFDLGAVTGFFSRLLPAGFYYKTFMWPRSFWKKLYEPAIRRMAGLGRSPGQADPDRYTQLYHHTDVLVIGAGPAGLAAALAAAQSGRRVMLVDEQAEMGGSLLHERRARIDGLSAADWLASALKKLAGLSNVTLLPRTTAFGYFPHNMIALAERVTDHLKDPAPHLPRERLWRVRAGEVVLATGAIERPLVFPGNDRPGILLSEAARIYVNRYGVRLGRCAVVATASNSAYRAALDLKAAGIEIAAIVDQRPAPTGPLIDAARAAGIRIETASAIGWTKGHKRLSGVKTNRHDQLGEVVASEWIRCDLLLMSGGWTPAVHLFSQARGQLVYDEDSGVFLPGTAVEKNRSAGACRGVSGLRALLEDGAEKGAASAGMVNQGPSPSVPYRVEDADEADPVSSSRGSVPYWLGDLAAKAFVDFQNDVTQADIRLAAREGMRSIEHLKRYTTTGMATDQGKTANMNALESASSALGRPVPEIGLTTFRMPYTPVSFGVFAGLARGDLFEPARPTPTDGFAQEHGAPFEPVGQWRRALYFPRQGETKEETIAREVLAIRQAAGVFDASTLGKIDVSGPDAAWFLNRLYTGSFDGLAVGRCRYGLMLREDGFILDDGVVARLAEDRFHVTTTSGGAARVFAHMEDYRQCEWPERDVWTTSVTEEWAVIAVQGPKARAIIAPLIEGIDLAPEAMPHMSVREGRFCGIPCRLFRLSFTGECGYEINVPSSYGRAAFATVLEAGKSHGAVPYGTEAAHIARAEKGYIIIGQETDGTVVPDDVGLSSLVSRKKADFVGMRALARPAMQGPGRKQLVGLLPHDPEAMLEEGAQVIEESAGKIPTPMLGHVTSAYKSPTLGRSIALALVKGGRGRIGATLYVPMGQRVIAVRVSDPIFYDREGARLHG